MGQFSVCIKETGLILCFCTWKLSPAQVTHKYFGCNRIQCDMKTFKDKNSKACGELDLHSFIGFVDNILFKGRLCSRTSIWSALIVQQHPLLSLQFFFSVKQRVKCIFTADKTHSLRDLTLCWWLCNLHMCRLGEESSWLLKNKPVKQQ